MPPCGGKDFNIMSIASSSTLTIGELARGADLAPETLRHYERMGLIAPSGRTASNYRLYDTAAVDRLRFIRRALTLGFSLGDIRELLDLRRDAAGDMGTVKDVVARRVSDIERRINDLEQLRDGLQALAASCPGHGARTHCPILAALARAPDA